MRVVSMIASSTEIVCALGGGDLLVGRSHECDYPESVRRLPALTRPRLDPEAASAEIDRQVKSRLRESAANPALRALSIYDVDAERLRELKPDLIITQTQCEVCAVSLRDVEAALAGWIGSRPKLVALQPDSLADIFGDVRRVAAALGAPERGETLVGELQARMEAVAARARAAESAARAALIEWIDPPMAAGNWMPELARMAGGEPLFGEAGKHSPWLEWEDLRAADPDVMVILPCGFDIPRARRELPALAGRPGWRDLAAARSGRVFLADGNQYFNRPGPRVADSLEILAELFHPELFAARWQGRGWERA